MYVVSSNSWEEKQEGNKQKHTYAKTPRFYRINVGTMITSKLTLTYGIMASAVSKNG